MKDDINYELILEELFDGLFILDNQLQIVSWNHAMESMTCLMKDDVLGKYVFDVIPSLEEKCGYFFQEAILEENRLIELQSYTFQKPKSQINLSVRARFIPMEKDGQTNGIVGILKPISEEASVQDEYTNLLKSVVMNTHDAVLITRPEPIDAPEGPMIIYANPAFTAMTGYTQEEILGKTPRILQGPKTSNKEKKRIRKALSNWERVDCELLNYTKDGKEFWVDLGIVPVQNEEGYYTHWIAVQRDVSERRDYLHQLEHMNDELEKKVLERTKELENFSYFLAHDLKQPTRSISSFIDLINKENGNLSDNANRYLEYVKQGSKSINRIVDAMLNLTVLSQKELQLEYYRFDNILEEAMSGLSALIRESEAVFEIGSMPEVKVDFALAVRLMLNLMENAIKYSGERQPYIRISAEQYKQQVSIRITDNGIGFSKSEKHGIFDLFNRGKQDVKRADGYGIGLAICKRVMDKHHGNIWIEANEEEGSTVVLSFPAKARRGQASKKARARMK